MIDGNRFVFNIVWAGTAFEYLQYFVASQIANSDAQFRFVINACPPGQIDLISEFADRYPDRILELFTASETEMISHGAALDLVLDRTDDGKFFAMIDPDILARGPFLDDFARRLAGDCDAVSSARGVWCESDVVPVGHPGLAGEFFYSPTGFVFGGPHFAIYRRAVVDAVRDRWGVGFAENGSELADDVRKALADAGHAYWMYDTGKIMNILLQVNGSVLCHDEHPNLLHVGGVTHYLSLPEVTERAEYNAPAPRWAKWDTSRFEVAQFSAAVLGETAAGRPAPDIPDSVPADLIDRLSTVRDELVTMVETYQHGRNS